MFVFFKQKTAYEMRISDWSSDVCSSDLQPGVGGLHRQHDREELRSGALRRFFLPKAEGGWNLWLFHRRSAAQECRLPTDVWQHVAHPGSRHRKDGFHGADGRSEVGRVGQGCFITCRYRWSPIPSKKKK